jgi:CubicO group peptidase (beta-lactamase class C family)
MKSNRIQKFLVFTLLIGGAFLLAGRTARLGAQEKPRADADINALLDKCVVQQKRAPGIVIGVVDDKGPRVFARGVRENGQTDPVDGDTLFEIGSVTKVFTALLLQEMVDSGEVTLNDPISKFLPHGLETPMRKAKEITLVDLATQTSGLPRLPDNLNPKDPENPYADYTVEQLYAFLSRYELKRDIGRKFEYSNLGVGLLGHLLALRAGTNYEALVVRRVCDPLKMNSTRITLSTDLKSRLALGHNGMGLTVPNWDLPTLAGAGALRSTANDLLNFLAASSGLAKSVLSTAMLATQQPRASSGAGRMIGLIWQIQTNTGTIWHNGGTGGYHSYIGFKKRPGLAVVVLANSENDIDDLGQYLLGDRADVEDFQPPKAHKLAKVDPGIYDHYAGTYNFPIPGVTLTVTRKDDHLFARLTGQQDIEFFPETETDYFCKVVDAQLTFEKDASGAVMDVVLHQNGMNQTATKGTPPKEPKVAQVDPGLYDKYTGVYHFPGADATLTVTREGNQLYARLTGQDQFEIFPKSETDFFLKVVDAQLTFEKDATGAATAVVLHQNGLDQKATKGAPPKERKVAQVDPRIYDKYIGVYKFTGADATITVTREGNQLFVRLTGQDRFEIFPKSETDFFLKVVDAQVTFEKDAAGAVKDLILHQNGQDQKVIRVKK